MNPDLMTIDEAAGLLGISRKAVTGALCRQRLSGVKLGRCWVAVWRDDIPAYQELQARHHNGNGRHRHDGLWHCQRCGYLIPGGAFCELCADELAGLSWWQRCERESVQSNWLARGSLQR